MFKTIAITALIIGGIAGIIKWSAAHDVALMHAMDQYDACMLETYRMTGAQYYAQHGNLPECSR